MLDWCVGHTLSELRAEATRIRLAGRSKHRNKAALCEALNAAQRARPLRRVTARVPAPPLVLSPVPPTRPTTIPREPGDLARASLCWKWTACLRATTEDGWDVAVLPANTVLFHGTGAEFGVPDGELPDAPAYFASLAAASRYAFRGEDNTGEEGKVISAISTRAIPLLAITRGNVERLSRLPGFPAEDFAYAFFPESAPECDRVSHRVHDGRVTRFICDSLPQLPFRAQGWAFPAPRCFHDEVVVCETDSLARTPLEVRYLSERDPDDDRALVVWDGRIVDEIPLGCLELRPLGTGGRFERFGELYEPSRERARMGDAYLLDPGWRRRIEDVLAGRTERPPEWIDFATLPGIECRRA